jgi:hypothetical protein
LIASQPYSKLSLDKTNGPTAAATAMRFAPTTRPSSRAEDATAAALDRANERLEQLEKVTRDLKSSQEEVLRGIRGLNQLIQIQ